MLTCMIRPLASYLAMIRFSCGRLVIFILAGREKARQLKTAKTQIWNHLQGYAFENLTPIIS